MISTLASRRPKKTFRYIDKLFSSQNIIEKVFVDRKSLLFIIRFHEGKFPLHLKGPAMSTFCFLQFYVLFC